MIKWMMKKLGYVPLNEVVTIRNRVDKAISGLRTEYVTIDTYSNNDKEYQAFIKYINDSRYMKWFMFQMREYFFNLLMDGNLDKVQLYQGALTAIDFIKDSMKRIEKEYIENEQQD